MSKRFVEMKTPPKDGYATEDTKWWYDTDRPLSDPEQPYMAVQTYADKDANDYRRIDGLKLLFTDPCEYYFVCPACRAAHARQQWSGSTRGRPGWEERAEKALAKHQQTKGWCEFCDSVFGNGGWSTAERY